MLVQFNYELLKCDKMKINGNGFKAQAIIDIFQTGYTLIDKLKLYYLIQMKMV